MFNVEFGTENFFYENTICSRILPFPDVWKKLISPQIKKVV